MSINMGPSRNMPTLCGWLACAGLCLALVISMGCARWTEVAAPAGWSKPPASAPAPSEERVPIVLSPVQMVQNGTRVNANVALERRALSMLQDTNLFSQLLQTGYVQVPVDEKFVTARLSITETVEPHAGDAAWKGFVIGASMFLLSPVIPLEYDYAAEMTLELERWDGETKRYRASSQGTAYYYLFGATPLAAAELKGQVTELCLQALAQQVTKDSHFVVASSAPLPDSRIKAISVRANKSASTVLPVSTTIEPPAQ